jgi:hypothetical protein
MDIGHRAIVEALKYGGQRNEETKNNGKEMKRKGKKRRGYNDGQSG